MSDILKLVFSLSLSGSLLIALLFLCKPFYKNRMSKRWQYYIWLVVVARLLLPFAPKENLMGALFERAGQAIEQAASAEHKAVNAGETVEETRQAGQTESITQQTGQAVQQAEAATQQAQETAPVTKPAEQITEREYSEDVQGKNSAFMNAETRTLIMQYLGLIWLGIAIILLTRKTVIYQSFVKYMKTGWKEVSDVELLNLLAKEEERMDIKRPVGLYTNELVSSPLLLGIIRPSIVLPTAGLPKEDFCYTVRHELIHYKRCDMLYKWFMCMTVCFHWFNPLVWLMRKETERVCELACDEALIAALNGEERKVYGDVLLHAAENRGLYMEPSVSASLSKGGKLLKERLYAIMHFEKKSGWIAALSVVLTAALLLGATLTGAAAPGRLKRNLYEDAGTGKSGERTVEEAAKNAYYGRDTAQDETAMDTLEFRGTTYYLVFNETQLRAIAAWDYGLDKNYMQQADISLSSDEWTPIGTPDEPFTGSYNGNGYAITGLTMTDTEGELTGLFGAAKNAHIYNITLRYPGLVKSEETETEEDYPILAKNLGGVRIYDNAVYLQQENVTETALQGTDSNETGNNEIGGNGAASKAEQYYQNGSVSGFGRAFAELAGEQQEEWLERLYKDREIAFFSVALQQLDKNSLLIERFAEKAYKEEEFGFFSVLSDYMEKDVLESWLDKAVEEKKFGFQLVLYTALDRDWEKEEMEEELDRQRQEEYKSVGITREGKKYYYQGQLVNIFLDMRPDSAFYTLDMNPDGVINIKIVRDADGSIKGVEYMTEEEVEEKFGDVRVIRGEEG